jgi:hypothetical protein
MAIFEDYISLKDAANISGYHSDYIGALVRSGKIKGKKSGNRWVVSSRDVQVHFSKKHYTPAGHIFFSRKNIIVVSTVILVIVFFSISFVQNEPTSSAQNNLENTITSTGTILIQQP